MVIEGISYCDLCGAVIFPDDGTPVKIEKDGHVHQFNYHNRNGSDCLAQEIAILKERFAALQS